MLAEEDERGDCDGNQQNARNDGIRASTAHVSGRCCACKKSAAEYLRIITLQAGDRVLGRFALAAKSSASQRVTLFRYGRDSVGS
jgi:hypothetical protein